MQIILNQIETSAIKGHYEVDFLIEDNFIQIYSFVIHDWYRTSIKYEFLLDVCKKKKLKTELFDGDKKYLRVYW